MKLLKYLPFFLAFLAFLIYLITAAPFMLWLDAPRFISAIVTLGIANPPEPLYVALAHPFIYLPFGSIVFRLQLFSALTAAITLLLLYKLILLLLNTLNPKSLKNHQLLAALFGAATLAFSYQFWSQAQNVENFILVTLMAVGTLYLTVKINSKKGMLINLSLVALILGLATGTNPVIASVVPAILWMMWVKRKYLTIPGLIIWVSIGVVAIIVIHLYIPIRASANPFLNYWRATTFERVWNASTGADLNVYVPSLGRINGFTGSPEIFFQSSFNFFKNLFLKFTPLLLPFIVLGAIYLWRRGRQYFYFLMSIVLTNFIFSGLYFSGNQESWFLMSDIAWVIMAGLGFFWLVSQPEEIIPSKLRLLKLLKLFKKHGSYLALLALIPLIVWFPFLNRRGWALTADYIDNLYRPMQGQKAILFGSSDLYDSVSFYVHDVAGTPHYNPDIIPITDNLFYIYQWYRDNITSHSDLKMPDALGLKYNSIHEYSQFVNNFFELNIDKYNIYITVPAARNNFLLAYGEESDTGASLKVDETKFKVVPQGMLLQVLPKEATDEPQIKNFDYQFKSKGFPQNKPFLLEKTFATELTGVLNEYAYSLESLGDYYLKQNKPEQVLDFYQRALDFNPKNAEIISRLGNYYGSTGNHAKAVGYFEKALKIEPKNIGLLFNSAIAYANTGRVDKAIANLNKVLQFSKGNSQISQLARVQLDALKQATPSASSGQVPSAQVATASGDLQAQLLPKAPTGVPVYQNQALNMQFNYPQGYEVTEANGVVTLTNKLTGKDELTLNFYSRKMGEGEAVDKLAENLPFKIDGAQLLSQPISLAGFSGVGRTIGSGEHLTFLLLLRRNDQGLVIKVYPGDTSKTEEFNQILGSITTLR